MHQSPFNNAHPLPVFRWSLAARLNRYNYTSTDRMSWVAEGRPGRRRRGAAAVEAALSLPILLILVLGSMESANAVFARQAVSTAAYDAARIATKRGGTQAQAEARCQQMLNAHGITNYSLTMSPTVNVGTARGTTVRATVTVPAQHVSLGLMPLFSGTTLHKTVQMIRL